MRGFRGKSDWQLTYTDLLLIHVNIATRIWNIVLQMENTIGSCNPYCFLCSLIMLSDASLTLWSCSWCFFLSLSSKFCMACFSFFNFWKQNNNKKKVLLGSTLLYHYLTSQKPTHLKWMKKEYCLYCLGVLLYSYVPKELWKDRPWKTDGMLEICG